MAYEQIKGLSAAASAAFLGSAFGLLMRLLGHYGPFGVIALRGSLQVLFFVCVLLCAKRFALHREIYDMGRLGFLAVLGMAGQNFGISVSMLMTTVSNVLFCINTAPAFCVIGDALFLKEKIPCRTRVMVVVCLVGVLIILVGSFKSGNSGGSFAGCLVALVNPISWATYWGIQRHRSKIEPKRVNAELPLILLCAQTLLVAIGTVSSIATHSIPDGFEESRKRDAVAIDIATFVCFSIAFLPCVQVLFSLAPRYIPTAQVACVKITETIWGPLWIYIFEGEKPEWYTLFGGAMIFIAILGHSFATLREGVGAVNSMESVPGSAPCGNVEKVVDEAGVGNSFDEVNSNQGHVSGDQPSVSVSI